MEVRPGTLAADFCSRTGAWLSSFHRGCGNLFAGCREDSAPRAVPHRTRILSIACAPDAVSECSCVFFARDSSSCERWAVLVASGVDFLAAPRMLGVERTSFSERKSPPGWSLPGRRSVDDPGGGHCALHHGPVFESAEPGGVRGNLHGGTNCGEKICTGIVVAGVCGLHASADVGVSIFVLCVAARVGKIPREVDARKWACRSAMDAACPRGLRGLSRSGETA